MVDKISQKPSDYSTPQLPEVGVNAPIDEGINWGSVIKTISGAYSSAKTSQFLKEQEASAEAIRGEHAQNKNIEDISIARNIMEKQASGAVTEEETKELERINKEYGNLRAAVEQGRQTQRGFELKAQALLRESIKRRPDLSRELNDIYSKAVGTPSLEMLQHRYFAEDLDWVGGAAKAKDQSITEADVSRLTDDAAAVAKVLPRSADADVINAAIARSVAIRARGGSPEEALAPMQEPAVQAILGGTDGQDAVTSGVQEFLRITKATRDFPRKFDGFYGIAINLTPNSPEWMDKIDTARQMKTIIQAESIALAGLQNNDMAKQKIAQNTIDIEYLDGILQMADDPQKAANFIQSRKTFMNIDLDPQAKAYLSYSMKDYSEETRAPVGASFVAGTNARKLGYHGAGYQVTNPATLQLFAGNLARNPKGDRMSSQELTGNSMLLTGILADWGSPIKNSSGLYVARSLEDYTNLNQGVLASVTTMIPALNQTYMTEGVAKEKDKVYAKNIAYLAGILDQANIAAHKRLENEGLSEYIKRYNFQKTLAEGEIPDFERGIVVVGNPSAKQRKRIDEIVGGLNTQIRPIGVAISGYAKILVDSEKAK